MAGPIKSSVLGSKRTFLLRFLPSNPDATIDEVNATWKKEGNQGKISPSYLSATRRRWEEVSGNTNHQPDPQVLEDEIEIWIKRIEIVQRTVKTLGGCQPALMVADTIEHVGGVPNFRRAIELLSRLLQDGK